MASSPTYQRPSVSAELVTELIAAAQRKAEELGKPFTVAVVDESGVLKGLLRMGRAPLWSVQVAKEKGYSAVGFGIPSHSWHDFIKDDPPLAAGAPTGIDRLVVFGGGYPIVIDGAVVGGVGVSGGHYSEDMEVAEAALAVLG